MTRTVSRIGILTSTFLFLFFTACGQSGSSGQGANLNSGGTGFGTGGFGTGSSFGDGTTPGTFPGANTTANNQAAVSSVGDLGTAIGQAAGTASQSGADPSLTSQAQTQATSGFNDVGGALQQLLSAAQGNNAANAAAAQQAFQQALSGLDPLVQTLNQLNLTALAFAVQEFQKFIPVYRSFNPAISRHFVSTWLPEVVNAAAAGFHYEGVAFWVRKAKAGIWTRELFDCYWPGGNSRFVSTDANCEGQPVVRSLGWVSPSKQGRAQNEIHRLFFPTTIPGYFGGDHLITTNGQEAAAIQSWGWRMESILGYTK